MKRILILLLILTVAVFAVACNETGSGGESSSSTPLNNTPSGDDPVHEHSFGEWKTVKVATCTEAGSEERACECGEREENTLEKLAHTYIDTVVEPTCTSEGYTRHECACGDSYEDNRTEKLAHSYVATVTPPTATENGYTTYACVCGDTYTSDYVPFLNSEKISIVENGQATLRVVLPKDASMAAVYAKDRFILEIEKLTGVTLSFGYADDDEAECEYELLIGDTGRAGSNAAASSLSTGEFAIKTEGNKIIVVADEDALLYEAVSYLIDNYFEGDFIINENDSLRLSASINENKKGDVGSLYYLLLSGTGDLSFTSDAFCSISNDKYYHPGASYTEHIYRRQGGCLTDKAMYQALISASQEIAVVVRKDLATGEIIYSTPIPMSHANDMTYNPNTNEVYVGYGAYIWVYDADTLEYKGEKTVDGSAGRISYSPEHDTFIIGSFKFFASDFTYIENSFARSDYELYLGGDKSKTLTGQGSACDDTFIYALVCRSVGGKYNTYIAVYDWYGNFVRFITVSIEQGFEPENISIIDGELYIGACSKQPVVTQYKVNLDSVKVDSGAGGSGDNNNGETNALGGKVEEVYTLANEYASTDSDPRVHRRRGCYFDGTNYYQAYLSAKNDFGVIAKKNVGTGEIIYSEPMNLGDPKDITYDKENNRLVVVSKSGELNFFDVDTLKHLGTVELQYAATLITYHEKSGLYYAIWNGRVYYLEKDFTTYGYGEEYDAVEGYTAHAMASDKDGNNYVLYIKSTGPEMYTGRIAVYDKNLIKIVSLIDFTLPNSVEPTGMSIVNGEIYVSGCSTQPVTTLYKITVEQ